METPISRICGHRLTISSGFAFRCYWCKTGGYISNGYHCTECDIWFHEYCVYAKFSVLINHTSHPEHLLHKTRLFPWTRYLCSRCRKFINDDWAYTCSTENFSLHLSCAIEPPPLIVKHPQAHKHPLVLFPVSRNPEHPCEACKENVIGKLAYICSSRWTRCEELVFHVKCVNSQEVNHHFYPKHSLKLLTSGAPDYTDNTCLLCGLKLDGALYHCSICNFSVCLVCASIPPPVDVEHLKTHEHKLTLIARQISFTCNACGLQGNHSPYLCLQCDFMVHHSCIDLPHVININRHDHRISHVQQLSYGDWLCKVCLQSVNRFYGAYKCSVCINYVVHSQCATRNDVWDGIELEGIPGKTEDIAPFKVVGDNLINHFSHEKHDLKLNKNATIHGGSMHCEACMLPVYSDSVYGCDKCGFVLHEICANLPRRKQHMLHNKPFTLNVGSPKGFYCSACEEVFNGFRYESDNVVLDVRCMLTSELFSPEIHEHLLQYNKTYIGYCDACDGSIKSGALSCGSCDYNLDFRCASLPKTVKHMYDQHPLSLSYKEIASGKYWCDICEEEMVPNEWFYTCSDCEVVLHVECVLGDFSRLKPGRVVELRKFNFLVITNNHSSRPICSACKRRWTAPFILEACDFKDSFFCSRGCLDGYTTMFT